MEREARGCRPNSRACRKKEGMARMATHVLRIPLPTSHEADLVPDEDVDRRRVRDVFQPGCGFQEGVAAGVARVLDEAGAPAHDVNCMPEEIASIARPPVELPAGRV